MLPFLAIAGAADDGNVSSGRCVAHIHAWAKSHTLPHTHTHRQTHLHTHTHTSANTHTHTHTQTHAHTHAHTYTHTHALSHTYTHTYTHTHTHALSHIHTHTYIHTLNTYTHAQCIHTHTCTHTCAHTHMHTHTHTQHIYAGTAHPFVPSRFQIKQLLLWRRHKCMRDKAQTDELIALWARTSAYPGAEQCGLAT